MNKTFGYALVAVILAAGLGFWGGMSYGKAKSSVMTLNGTTVTGFPRGQFGPNSFGRGTNGVGGTSTGSRAGFASGGFVSGQILSKDANSFTVQLPNSGGTKIVIFGTSTQVQKSTAGSVSDIIQGQNVMVSGTPNSDGSVTAQNVQIRPEISPATQR